MAKRNHHISDNYDWYKSNMSGDKYIDGVFIVDEPKSNHKQSHSAIKSVTCSVPFGNNDLHCEIRESSEYNYSFTYLTDFLDNRVMARLDAGNGTHRNKAPGIPLQYTSVPTPHFHEYRSDGYLIAYPIESIDYSKEDSVKFDFIQGYEYLCKKLAIHNPEGGIPKFEFRPKNILPFTSAETDPNLDIHFPDID